MESSLETSAGWLGRKQNKAAEIEEKVKQSISLMPADLQKVMSVKELIDVVEYLTTLKEAAVPEKK